MKKVVLGIFLLVLLAVVGGAAYVSMIDWNQHKDKIAEQFYNSTGKSVSFDGKVSFRIFPSPYLNAADVKVYNTQDKNELPLLEIKNLVAELSLGALLKGEFEVKKMILDGAVINLDWDNGLNWQSDLSPDQRQQMEDTKMVLNSVSLKDAVLNFEAREVGIKWHLTKLNGEVAAQSIFGPFRIEGNYLKGNSPEGFAISIGKLSDSFATTLNMVVTHPQSDSYVRFDGNFYLPNKLVNGNVIIETKKLSDFINANFEKANLASDYNTPAVLGFDIVANPKNLALSNVVIKYGETQGAGEIQVPLDDLEIPEITTNFNFTDLDLAPFVKLTNQFINKYKEEAYAPNYGIDLTGEVKAIRVLYDGQNLKNMEMSFGLDNDTFTLDDFSVILPGETVVKLKGMLYPYDETVYYQAETAISANDLMKTLKWLEIEPKANAASVYKKMLATAKLTGNFDRVQVSPYKVTIDKSTFSGEATYVSGDRKDLMLVVQADTINFDNYISSLPEEEKSKSWTERMAYRFKKLEVLNEFDMELNAKADLVIYESMPFEKVDFKGNLFQGKADIDYCKIEQVANTGIALRGTLQGFGNVIQMDNLQYEIKSSDILSLINKLELKVPQLDYKKFSAFELTGTINGVPDNFALNTALTLGQLNAAYQGKALRKGDGFSYDGHLELKHPDFAALLENLKASYDPAVKNLGLLNFASDIKGDKSNMDFSNMTANIGYNTFAGQVTYDNTAERPSFLGNLKINKFEIDKFLQKSKENGILDRQTQETPAEFLEKPFWNRDKIDYTPYLYADVKGKFDVGELSYKSHIFKDSQFDLDVVQGVASLKDFKANYHNTPIALETVLHMDERPTVSGSGKIENAQVNEFALGGKTYYLRGGAFAVRFDFSSQADSLSSFVSNLKGKAEFRDMASEVGGMDLAKIYADLIRRDKTEGLADMVKNNVKSGVTLFDKISGRLLLEDGKYTLAEAAMKSSDAEIKVYGEGDLTDWTMNLVFNIKYNEPKYLPEFSFSLRNSMENPSVDVNVSSLFKLYEATEKQKEETKAAEVAAEKSYWNERVEAQKTLANETVLAVRNGLEKLVDQRSALAENQETVNAYTLLKQDIAQALASLVEKMDNFNTENVTEESLSTLSDANEKIKGTIKAFEKRCDDIYLSDLKKSYDKKYVKALDSYNLLKKSMFSYHAQTDRYVDRLAKIKTDYTLESDADFQLHKKKVDAKIKDLNQTDKEMEQIQERNKDNASIADYEQINQKLSDISEAFVQGRQFLDNSQTLIDEIVLPKISDAEKAYKLSLAEAADQKRVEENTGSISIKKTGKTLTVTRDLEDIKTAEEEISKEEVKVLDFSKEKSGDTLNKPDKVENVVKKSRNVKLK